MRLVPNEYLKENSEVAIDIINDEGKLLLHKGQRLTQRCIDSLKNLGISNVYIKDEYCINNVGNRGYMDPNNILPFVKKLREIAQKVCLGISGRSDIEVAIFISKKIVDSVKMNRDLKIAYEPNKMVINSIIERSIYVAIMSTILGDKMNMSKDRLVKLCLAGLLKDIALISPKIQSDKVKLIYQHPILGYWHLKEHYDLDEEVLCAVLQHQELFDGTGYPNKLRGKEICEFASIIGIVDMFYEIKTTHYKINNSQKIT